MLMFSEVNGEVVEEAPVLFAAYPEFYVEDMLDLLAFALKSAFLLLLRKFFKSLFYRLLKKCIRKPIRL